MRASLRRRFSNQPNTIETADGAEQLSARSPRRRWIVGRGLCLYRCEDFVNLPRARRRAALELNIPVWSPFARTGHHCVWVDATAMVWMWDAEQVGGAAPADGIEWLPETVLLPKKEDGVHLQACHRGFELQHWRGGVLRDSYWQREQPDQAHVDWFAGRAPQAAAPAAESDSAEQAASAVAAPVAAETFAKAIATAPWATPITPGDWLRAHERKLVAGGLALFALLASWQEARIWTFAAHGAAAAVDVERRQDELEPLLRARAEMRRLRERNGALAALLSTPSQPELMNLVDQALPKDVELRQWRYQSGDLALVLTGPNLDPVACVEGLAKLFEAVTLGRRQQPGRVDVSLKVPPALRSAS